MRALLVKKRKTTIRKGKTVWWAGGIFSEIFFCIFGTFRSHTVALYECEKGRQAGDVHCVCVCVCV